MLPQTTKKIVVTEMQFYIPTMSHDLLDDLFDTLENFVEKDGTDPRFPVLRFFQIKKECSVYRDGPVFTTHERMFWRVLGDTEWRELKALSDNYPLEAMAYDLGDILNREKSYWDESEWLEDMSSRVIAEYVLG